MTHWGGPRIERIGILWRVLWLEGRTTEVLGIWPACQLQIRKRHIVYVCVYMCVYIYIVCMQLDTQKGDACKHMRTRMPKYTSITRARALLQPTDMDPRNLECAFFLVQ
jgi:hypothetical protein